MPATNRSKQTKVSAPKRTKSCGCGESPKPKRHPKKHWSELAPNSRQERQALFNRCGRVCFLDPENLKYPVCQYRTKTCKPSPQGLAAARSRARLQKNMVILKKLSPRRRHVGHLRTNHRTRRAAH